MNTAKCVSPISFEYITPGETYQFYAMEDGHIRYARADGAGSWMRRSVWDASVESGKIIISDEILEEQAK